MLELWNYWQRLRVVLYLRLKGDIVTFMVHDALGNESGNQQGVVKFKFGSYLIGGYNMYDILLNDEEAEVIGNIHDNFDLLNSL